MSAIGVIGGGSWGTALAQLQASEGRNVALWARREAAAAEIARGESAYLPGVPLSPAIEASSDPAVLGGAEVLLSVVPVQAMRSVLERLAPALPEDAPVVVCSKGLERGTLALPAAIAAETLAGRPVAVLSGPSFAADVVRGKPTAVTVAAATLEAAGTLQRALSAETFRLYPSDDPVGVQMGGALKNVIAIACGIAAARGLGESAVAALIARGGAEMTRLAVACGARAETLAGLSGLGDLVLTCTSAKSRNYSAGLKIGDPETETAAQGVSEGRKTADAAVALAREKGVEMPICETVNVILGEALTVDEGIETLLGRPPRGDEAA